MVWGVAGKTNIVYVDNAVSTHLTECIINGNFLSFSDFQEEDWQVSKHIRGGVDYINETWL